MQKESRREAAFDESALQQLRGVRCRRFVVKTSQADRDQAEPKDHHRPGSQLGDAGQERLAVRAGETADEWRQITAREVERCDEIGAVRGGDRLAGAKLTGKLLNLAGLPIAEQTRRRPSLGKNRIVDAGGQVEDADRLAHAPRMLDENELLVGLAVENELALRSKDQRVGVLKIERLTAAGVHDVPGPLPAHPVPPPLHLPAPQT